jgi:hypothetical protein
MACITGTVTVVHEGRFRLASDEGIVRQFVLSRDAALEPQDLPPLAARQARVRVYCNDSDHLIAGIVYRIELDPPDVRTQAGGIGR